MPKFRKKPIVIEAIQSTDTPEKNREIIDWTRGSKTPAFMDKHPEHGERLSINTLEGALWVSPGDWVIKGVAGEFYPCKSDIFAATYDEVHDSDCAVYNGPAYEPGPCDCSSLETSS